MSRRSRRKRGGGFRFHPFRMAGELFMVLFVIVVFLTLAQCTVKEPVSPTWDTNFILPLVNRTYPMQEIVEKIDQDGIGIDTAGAVTFSLTRTLDTLRFDGDDLSTADLQYLTTERVNSFNLNPPVVAPVSVSLSSIAGLSSGLPGDTADITPLGFNLINTMTPIQDFQSATIQSGTVLVRIANNLGVSLDTVITDLYDIGESRVVSTDTFVSPLLSGGIDTVSIDLSGQIVSNQLRVLARCHTPGGTVTSVSSRSVSTEVLFPSVLTVSEAVAKIPPFTRSLSEQLPLAESGRLDSAVLRTGAFRANITNATAVPTTFTLIAPNLLLNGNPLSVTRVAGAFQTVSAFIDLANYTLLPSDLSVPQQVALDVSVNVAGTGDQHATVRASDSFLVVAEVSNLTFARLTGALEATVVNFANVQQSIDPPMGMDSISFEGAVLTLEIENALDMPGTISMNIFGSHGKTMALSGPITPGTATTPSVAVLSDPSVSNFLSPIPSSITVSGSAMIGDGTYTGTITDQDVVVSRVTLTAPLVVAFPSTTITPEVTREEIDQDDVREIVEGVTNAALTYTLTNRLPVGAFVSLFVSADSTMLYTNPTLRFDSLGVGAAPVGIGGFATGETTTGERTLAISDTEADVLLNPVLYFGQQITLESTNGQFVRLVDQDYLRINARIEVAYRFDGSL